MSVNDLAAHACEEVQALGRLDEACIELLYALMREEIRRFAVLCPPSGWDRDTVDGFVSEFFVEKVEKLTADLVTIGVTPQVVGKVMRRWIRNFLIDRARSTPLGRIRRKIEGDILGQYPEFLLCVPKISSTSCDQVILVNQATDLSVLSDAVPVEVDGVG
jgi:hypothetical protein